MASSTITKFNFKNMPSSKKSAITWAQDHGLLRTSKKCSIHRCEMKILKSTHGIGRFRCPVGRDRCRQYSLTVDSFFMEVRMSLDNTIRLMYCFTRDFSYADTVHELCDYDSEGGSKTASTTIAAWFHYCREMIVDHFRKIQLGQPKLGGVSASGNAIIVQIDEAKFGKRKYSHGQRVEGHWILGMVDVESNDCWMVVVEDHTTDNLIAIIKENVATGSEIHADCFLSYRDLTVAGYIHKTVNQSIEYVGGDGTHIKRFVSNWRPAKDWMRGRGFFHDDEFADRMCEYLWRRYCHHHNIDLFGSLMEAIRMQYVFK